MSGDAARRVRNATKLVCSRSSVAAHSPQRRGRGQDNAWLDIYKQTV